MSRIIQVKFLGRLGNCMFQYACAKKYAQLHDAVLETPDWAGRHIFGLNDPMYSTELPERNDGGCGLPQDALRWGEVNVRLGGYFQFQEWIGFLSKRELQNWFKIDPKWEPYLPPSDEIVAHIRIGDNLNNPLFCVVIREAYHQMIEQFKLPADKVVYLSEENPTIVPELSQQNLAFLPDFSRMMRASTLIRANSTFSWWAATLSNAKVYSPVVEYLSGHQFAVFVEGNYPKCAHTSRVGVKITDLYLPA